MDKKFSFDKQSIVKQIGRKIREIRENLRMSSVEFSKFAGVSPATLLRIERGEVEPSIADLLSICYYLNIDLEFLLGKSEMYSSSDFIFVPLVEGRISAGTGLISQNNIVEFLAFKKEWLQRKGDTSRMVLIRVSGDSMVPTLQDGDLVLVDTSKNYIDPQGGIYAITIDDEIMVKRLQYIFTKTKDKKIKKKIKIISDNSAYESIELDIEDVIVNGKVIWYGREL